MRLLQGPLAAVLSVSLAAASTPGWSEMAATPADSGAAEVVDGTMGAPDLDLVFPGASLRRSKFLRLI